MTLRGYARVSTDQQALDIQLTALQAAGVREDRIETDVGTGSDIDRPGLQRLLIKAERGDRILITKLDRLGRDTIDMVGIVAQWTERGVVVEFLSDGISNHGPMGVMLMTILVAVAQAEKARIMERTNEGRVAAKLKGVKFGASQHKKARLIESLLKTGMQTKDIVEATGASPRTVQRYRNAMS